ncbi:MAG: lysylphosphatidylglycerol synthase transmembrane domain-containing protein [Planctomycetaceae bacterium]
MTAAPRKRSPLRILFTTAMTIVIAWLLFDNVSWQGVGEVLATIRWPWIAAMSATALFRTFVDSLQMRMTLAHLKLKVGVGRIFLGNALSSFYGLVLPGAVVSRGAKWGVLTSATGKGTAVLNAMIYNGMIQLVPIMLVGSGAMLSEQPFPGSGLTEATLATALATMAALVVLYHPRVGNRAAGILGRILDRMPAIIQKRGQTFLESLRDFQRFPWEWHGLSLALATAGLACALVRMGFGFQALQIELSPLRIAWIFIFLHVLRLLPITIGNFGIREGFLMVALGGFDVPQETAVSLGLLMYTDRLILAFIGACYQGVLLFGVSYKSESRDPIAAPSAGVAK